MTNSLDQRFSNGVSQEFLKHAVPASLVRSTDLISLRLSSKKTTTAYIHNSGRLCERPVLTHNCIRHVTGLHLIGHVP